jgi:thioredoxin-like negative regulator of GroEL
MPSASALEKMIPLLSHDTFEQLFTPEKKLEKPVIISFSASWCGPCSKLDWDFVLEEFPTIPIYYCDIDKNKYTPGFCNIKSIPSILMLTPGENRSSIVGPLQTSDTAKLCSWILMNIKSFSK